MRAASGRSKVVARRHGLAWLAAMSVFSSVGAVACNALLGMDAPSLNPCNDGCPDGAVDDGVGDDGPVTLDASSDAGTKDSGSVSDAGSDSRAPPNDAAPEAAPQCTTEAGVGIRCGGGDLPTCWCN